ncbi:biopolymer transporter Tol [Herbiconiux sp. UC225_62]|uniref:biopolymer transporter Tol n=1 Tax=Herbiconiux sp. UC225_62 TaxID=3350168 RepID=UPI0036D33200
MTPDDDTARWLVMGGRRWRRTDPALPSELADALRSHLGSARSMVGVAKRGGDRERMADARRRVDLAKHGLGERGPRWWDEPEAARLDRAQAALEQLDRTAH